MAYVPLREQDSKKSQGKPGRGGIGLAFCSDPPAPPPVEELIAEAPLAMITAPSTPHLTDHLRAWWWHRARFLGLQWKCLIHTCQEKGYDLNL